MARLGEFARAGVQVLHALGARHLRRGLRGPGLRHAGGRGLLRLAHARAGGGRAGARGDDAWAAHHGLAVRGLHGGLEQPAGHEPGDERVDGGARRDLLHLPAVLHLHLPRCALHRGAAREQESDGGARGRDGGGRGSDSEPRARLRGRGHLAQGLRRRSQLVRGRDERARLRRALQTEAGRAVGRPGRGRGGPRLDATSIRK